MFSVLAPLLALTLVFVPIDDRPVTAQLPRLLGAIAGVRIVEPPPALLGNYLIAGDARGILRWLADEVPTPQEYVVSSDMVDYGGLVASRIPAVSLAAAQTRVDLLAAVRASHSLAAFTVFGTVMRLAPTGVPALGPAASFPFAGSVWPQIQRYADLPSPPQTPQQHALAERLARQLGPNLETYLATRARDLAIDLQLLHNDAAGTFDGVVLGQDDAGRVGLHIPDLAALRAYATQAMPYGRWSIESGTDELGMVLVAAALVREAGLVPRVRVVYSRPDGARVQDPLEIAPIGTTIRSVIQSAGGIEAAPGDPGDPADVTLYVRVPHTGEADERAFVDAIASDPKHAAVADLSFLANGNLAEQRVLADELIARGVAGRVAAFASWNTCANTVGTAIPEAFAVLAGQRFDKYSALAHDTFTYMRYVDDVLYQKIVRPQVNADLSEQGIKDHTYLLPPVAAEAAADTRARLTPLALALLRQVDPEYHAARLAITLPWDRTFEMQLDVRLAP